MWNTYYSARNNNLLVLVIFLLLFVTLHLLDRIISHGLVLYMPNCITFRQRQLLCYLAQQTPETPPLSDALSNTHRGLMVFLPFLNFTRD